MQMHVRSRFLSVVGVMKSEHKGEPFLHCGLNTGKINIYSNRRQESFFSQQTSIRFFPHFSLLTVSVS